MAVKGSYVVDMQSAMNNIHQQLGVNAAILVTGQTRYRVDVSAAASSPVSDDKQMNKHETASLASSDSSRAYSVGGAANLVKLTAENNKADVPSQDCEFKDILINAAGEQRTASEVPPGSNFLIAHQKLAKGFRAWLSGLKLEHGLSFLGSS